MPVHGVSEVLAAFKEMQAAAEAASFRIVAEGSAVVESEVKKGFTTSHAKGVPTNASPGAPPAVVTGTLRRSIRSDKPVSIPGGAMGRVYPTAIYSRIQELGGEMWNGGYLPPRPYMQPGYERAKPKLEGIANAEWRKVTSG